MSASTIFTANADRLTGLFYTAVAIVALIIAGVTHSASVALGGGIAYILSCVYFKAAEIKDILTSSPKQTTRSQQMNQSSAKDVE